MNRPPNTHELSVANSERDAQIKRRWQAGEGAPALAREFNLSPERVYQIAKREPTQSQQAGYPVQPGSRRREEEPPS
jgi:Mor family transcriptional regulator